MLARLRVSCTAALGALALTSLPASAQHIARIPWALVQEVMPEAERFEEPTGDPPVVAAYATDPEGGQVLVGYVFLTSDLPPEQYGYSGPIEALVGMRLDGTLTGVRVTDYRESYMNQMGDFLRRRGFQEQFRDKYIGDPFRVWGDVDGMSRVTISVRALARGVRDASRRVAMAYSQDGTVVMPEEPVADIVGMSWFEMRRLGVVERFEVTEPGQGSAGISLAYISSDRVGEYLYGRIQYESAIRSMTRRGGAEHLMLYAVDGSRLRLFLREGWSLVQDGDTTAIDPQHVVMLGLPSGGVVSGEATMVGVFLIRRQIDIRKPFTFVYDLGELGVHSVKYTTQDARILIAEQQAAAEAEAARRAAEEEARRAAEEEARRAEEAERLAEAEAAAEPGATTPGATPAPPASEDDPTQPGPAAAAAPPPAGAPQVFDFVSTEDESWLERTLADASWSRVATMLLVLGLATWAFVRKSVRLRWVSLAVTLAVLGWIDGGFLSVSHITSGLWAGPGVYLRDLPLLLIVSFTLVTTLIWGRVFCGFLCPFGALQDVLERLVPRRWQRTIPQAVHDRAIWAKYGVLAVIVVPVLAGSQISLYQYFEPFGTVFFLSSSLLFWAIAGGFLLASAIVPRFYCRYACPLGAALALGSLVAHRRIRRVEQCGLCKVCEQKCPTGAIRGPDIDFKECVRCNVCEVQLLERRGVCRHDMEEIRPRLVQLRVAGRAP